MSSDVAVLTILYSGRNSKTHVRFSTGCVLIRSQGMIRGEVSPFKEKRFLLMSFHNLNGTDEIPVLKRCRKCGGTKEVRDAEGNTSPCTICDDKGKEIVPVRM